LKLAAIDIGSNAIRFQITNVIDYQGTHTFKKLEYVRFPLRLGKDVFESNCIGEENKAKFSKSSSSSMKWMIIMPALPLQ